MLKTLKRTICLAPLLFASCVDFEKSTISCSYNATDNELRVFIVYENIHTDGYASFETERKQLTADRHAV